MSFSLLFVIKHFVYIFSFIYYSIYLFWLIEKVNIVPWLIWNLEFKKRTRSWLFFPSFHKFLMICFITFFTDLGRTPSPPNGKSSLCVTTWIFGRPLILSKIRIPCFPCFFHAHLFYQTFSYHAFHAFTLLLFYDFISYHAFSMLLFFNFFHTMLSMLFPCFHYQGDEKMQWSSQISNITKKVNFKLGKIKSVASFLTSHTKKLLVNALVMPYFHYCSLAWSSAAPFRLRKVDKKVVDASNFLGREDNYSIYNV